IRIHAANTCETERPRLVGIGQLARARPLTWRATEGKCVLVCTRSNFVKCLALVVTIIFVVAHAFSQDAEPEDFAHVVRLNKTWSSAAGDTITVEQIRGPSSKWIVGSRYEVSGTYKLKSLKQASLGVYVTHAPVGGVAGEAVSREQRVIVSKGKG